MTEIKWMTVGIPVPQGSKRHVGNGIMIEQSAGLPAWRNQLIYDKPEAGKLYALTGRPGSKCIANGNTWEESVVGEEVKP